MSGSKFSLIDLGKVSKPLSKLVDAVSSGIGTIYEPTRIRRKARAQADALLIKTEADIKKKELMRRVGNRLAFQEISRQQNIENIIEIAADNLPDTVSDEPVDRDWVSRFFDDCKDVSNEELQKIWARVLASEVAKPSSCSRKTLSILKDITSNDAIIFKIFCSLVWDMGDDAYFLPYDKSYDIAAQLEKYGSGYEKSLHLENLGLIHCKMDISANVSFEKRINYINFNHISIVNPHNMVIRIKCFPLTKNGAELLKVSNRELNYEYYINCLKMFSNVYSIFLASPIN